MSVHLLYSPFPSLDAARNAAKALIERKLVACCNILSGAESHYIWEGQLTTTDEIILIAKTAPATLETAREALAAMHPYECPAILSFAATANPAFAAWVEASTH